MAPPFLIAKERRAVIVATLALKDQFAPDLGNIVADYAAHVQAEPFDVVMSGKSFTFLARLMKELPKFSAHDTSSFRIGEDSFSIQAMDGASVAAVIADWNGCFDAHYCAVAERKEHHFLPMLSDIPAFCRGLWESGRSFNGIRWTLARDTVSADKTLILQSVPRRGCATQQICNWAIEPSDALDRNWEWGCPDDAWEMPENQMEFRDIPLAEFLSAVSTLSSMQHSDGNVVFSTDAKRRGLLLNVDKCSTLIKCKVLAGAHAIKESHFKLHYVGMLLRFMFNVCIQRAPRHKSTKISLITRDVKMPSLFIWREEEEAAALKGVRLRMFLAPRVLDDETTAVETVEAVAADHLDD